MTRFATSAAFRLPHRDPIWWVLLAFWVLNDHVLKASPLAGPLTGKISDVTGLVVLPAGLAWLATSVPGTNRSTHGARLRLICGVVGLYFAALQLWPPLLHASHALLAALGIPSRITPDPSDLWALLVLPWCALRYGTPRPTNLSPRPAQPPHRAWIPPHFSLALPGYALMLMATVATSRIEADEGLGQTSRVFLHNATESAQSTQLLQLRDGVSIDCSALSAQPQAYLRAGLFELVDTLVLSPGQVVPLDAQVEPVDDDESGSPEAPCQAIVLRGDNRDPALLFWTPEDLTLRPLADGEKNLDTDGVIFIEASEPPNPNDPSSPPQQPVTTLQFGQRGDTRILYPLLVDPAPIATPECSPPKEPEPQGIGWDEDFPTGTHLLKELSVGADGCLALDLTQADKPGGLPSRHYLCVPPQRFPFEAGALLQFRSLEGEAAAIGDSIEGWRISPPQTEPALIFWAVRGKGLPQIGDLLFDEQERIHCDFARSERECMTLVRPIDITVNQVPSIEGSGPSIQTQALLPSDTSATTMLTAQGEPLSFDLLKTGQRVTLELLRSQERALIDRSCSDKELETGLDIHLIATWRRISP